MADEIRGELLAKRNLVRVVVGVADALEDARLVGLVRREPADAQVRVVEEAQIGEAGADDAQADADGHRVENEFEARLLARGVGLGLAQRGGALFDALFQERVRLLQFGLARLELRQHVVEAVDQLTDLIVAALRGATGVGFFQGHGAGEGGEFEDGLDEQPLEIPRHEDRQQE